LGNSTTKIDLSGTVANDESNPDVVESDSELNPDQDGGLGRTLVKRKAETDSCEGSDDDSLIKTEHKINSNTTQRKPAAHASIANPVATKKIQGKKKRMEEFVELAQAEEMTRQRELEVSKIQAEKSLLQSKAKLNLKLERLQAQREKTQLKARIKELQLKQEHECRLQTFHMNSIPTGPFPAASSSFTPTVPNPNATGRNTSLDPGGSSSTTPSLSNTNNGSTMLNLSSSPPPNFPTLLSNYGSSSSREGSSNIHRRSSFTSVDGYQSEPSTQDFNFSFNGQL